MLKILKGVVLTSVLSIGLYAVDVQKSDVEALVNEGAKYCEKVGMKSCLEEFNKPSSRFVIPEKELYIFAINFDGTMAAHPFAKNLVDQNLMSYKDRARKPLFKDMIKMAQKNKEGWIDYVWSHPKGDKVTDKTTYIKSVNDTHLLGAGIYK